MSLLFLCDEVLNECAAKAMQGRALAINDSKANISSPKWSTCSKFLVDYNLKYLMKVEVIKGGVWSKKHILHLFSRFFLENC